jgi:hypothetical protein
MARPTWWLLLLVAGAGLARPAPAQACGGGTPPAVQAFPRTGSADVSPITTIFLATGSTLPAGLVIEANGQPQPLPAILPLGSGPQGTWWQLQGQLLPAASYVVRIEGGKELTRFTTAATYDKPPGRDTRLDRLRLWRVRYSPADVGAGACVFAEFEGYADVDYQPPPLPGTPPDEAINVLSLTPRNGGVTQTLVFAGSEPIRLARTDTGAPVPSGQRPSPAQSIWKPELSADREYCATLTIYGRGSLALTPVSSAPLCAPVMSLNAPMPQRDLPPGEKEYPPGSREPPPRPLADAGAPSGGSDSADNGGCAMGHGRAPSWCSLLLALVLLRGRPRSRR